MRTDYISLFQIALTILLPSCSDDGTIVVNALQSQTVDSTTHNHYRPVKAVRLDPAYAQKKREKLYAAGGVAGQFVLNRKGWIMQKVCVCSSF